MKYFTGTWTWKSSDGNHGTVVFERFSNAQGQVVKERCENLDKSTVMTQGWRPDTKAFGGAGYDSGRQLRRNLLHGNHGNHAEGATHPPIGNRGEEGVVGGRPKEQGDVRD